MNHVHIISNGKTATVSLDANGHVVGDGSKMAENAIHYVNHNGLRPEHGQALLDSIVEKFGSSTLVHAHHCDQAH